MAFMASWTSAFMRADVTVPPEATLFSAASATLMAATAACSRETAAAWSPAEQKDAPAGMPSGLTEYGPQIAAMLSRYVKPGVKVGV